ncbi:2-hydroxyisoflavanone dehydratase-like [Hordeum vulgare subsp. vulgare]|uniref:2-hydroxyisoflavanone dehydratase-like n=1 Tax=Hordeum vulgare subsp. vulgare TaxID=112509 RepID=UPI001D1A37DD|nr:2-hydroxyisoflavanone dehydratase-like [Hordeum vulgare subsp. vulgare]
MAMHGNKSCTRNEYHAGDISIDNPFIRSYNDGSVERFLRSPFVPASSDHGSNRGVATRDVVVDKATGVSARLFLPSRSGRTRLPLVVYIHGGSFCTESAFCRTYHRYATSLAASAGALVMSVEYRLAPEFPIPAAYDDAWSALQWAASFSDPWLADYADPARTFIAGDSAGGNIVYHTAVRASHQNNYDLMDIEGLIMVQPYFWGTERLPSELVWEDGTTAFPPYAVDALWPFVTAGKAGNDDPRIDPPISEIASLACSRVFVAVAGNDTLRDRGCRLADRMRDNYSVPWMIGCPREVTVVESEGEEHGFHLYSPLRASSKMLMQSIVHFINKPTSTPAPMVLGMPTRPYKDVFGYGIAMKSWNTVTPAPSSTPRNNHSIKVGGVYGKKSYRSSFLGRMQRSNTSQKETLSAAVPSVSLFKNLF